ncbi:hypothetical protein EWM64_g2625 [Hericium alpestre]|uniref:Uncharacterized protein n=1 Tax=Hericium alpestre TaxID=135208 RepID=A0A4Z0A4K4_9AGAM|nr:hypothetical protein EWM64_g2625 [Hericium alpestre]
MLAADAKFPGSTSDALPPSPTPENPGAVYPKTDPTPAPPDSIPGGAKSVRDRALEAYATAIKKSGQADACSAETGGLFTD